MCVCGGACTRSKGGLITRFYGIYIYIYNILAHGWLTTIDRLHSQQNYLRMQDRDDKYTYGTRMATVTFNTTQTIVNTNHGYNYPTWICIYSDCEAAGSRQLHCVLWLQWQNGNPNYANPLLLWSQLDTLCTLIVPNYINIESRKLDMVFFRN